MGKSPKDTSELPTELQNIVEKEIKTYLNIVWKKMHSDLVVSILSSISDDSGIELGELLFSKLEAKAGEGKDGSTTFNPDQLSLVITSNDEDYILEEIEPNFKKILGEEAVKLSDGKPQKITIEISKIENSSFLIPKIEHIVVGEDVKMLFNDIVCKIKPKSIDDLKNIKKEVSKCNFLKGTSSKLYFPKFIEVKSLNTADKILIFDAAEQGRYEFLEAMLGAGISPNISYGIKGEERTLLQCTLDSLKSENRKNENPELINRLEKCVRKLLSFGARHKTLEDYERSESYDKVIILKSREYTDKKLHEFKDIFSDEKLAEFQQEKYNKAQVSLAAKNAMRFFKPSVDVNTVFFETVLGNFYKILQVQLKVKLAEWFGLATGKFEPGETMGQKLLSFIPYVGGGLKDWKKSLEKKQLTIWSMEKISHFESNAKQDNIIESFASIVTENYSILILRSFFDEFIKQERTTAKPSKKSIISTIFSIAQSFIAGKYEEIPTILVDEGSVLREVEKYISDYLYETRDHIPNKWLELSQKFQNEFENALKSTTKNTREGLIEVITKAALPIHYIPPHCIKAEGSDDTSPTRGAGTAAGGGAAGGGGASSATAAGGAGGGASPGSDDTSPRGAGKLKDAYLPAYLSALSYEEDDVINYMTSKIRGEHKVITSKSKSKKETDLKFIYSEIDGKIIISIRGTDNFKNVKRDINAKPTRCDVAFGITKNDEGESELQKLAIICHEGFWNAALEIWNEVKEKIYSNMNKELIITGHSLGGAIALALSGIIRSEKIIKALNGTSDAVDAPTDAIAQSEVSVYSFGAPMLLYDRQSEHWKKLNIKHYRYFNKDDVVPMLPPSYYEHCDTVCYVPTFEKTTSKPKSLFKKIVRVLSAPDLGDWAKGVFLDPTLKAHSMSGYLNKIEGFEKKDIDSKGEESENIRLAYSRQYDTLSPGFLRLDDALNSIGILREDIKFDKKPTSDLTVGTIILSDESKSYVVSKDFTIPKDGNHIKGLDFRINDKALQAEKISELFSCSLKEISPEPSKYLTLRKVKSKFLIKKFSKKVEFLECKNHIGHVRNLKEKFSDHKEHPKEYLFKVDIFDFSADFLSSILTGAFCGNPDKITGRKHIKDGATEKLEILNGESLFFSDTEHYGISPLHNFPQVNFPLHSKIITKLVKPAAAEEILSEWLLSIFLENEKLKKLGKEDQYIKIKSSKVVQIYDKLKQIIKIIKEDNFITAKEILYKLGLSSDDATFDKIFPEYSTKKMTYTQDYEKDIESVAMEFLENIDFQELAKSEVSDVTYKTLGKNFAYLKNLKLKNISPHQFNNFCHEFYEPSTEGHFVKADYCKVVNIEIKSTKQFIIKNTKSYKILTSLENVDEKTHEVVTAQAGGVGRSAAGGGGASAAIAAGGAGSGAGGESKKYSSSESSAATAAGSEGSVAASGSGAVKIVFTEPSESSAAAGGVGRSAAGEGASAASAAGGAGSGAVKIVFTEPTESSAAAGGGASAAIAGGGAGSGADRGGKGGGGASTVDMNKIFDYFEKGSYSDEFKVNLESFKTAIKYTISKDNLTNLLKKVKQIGYGEQFLVKILNNLENKNILDNSISNHKEVQLMLFGLKHGLELTEIEIIESKFNYGKMKDGKNILNFILEFEPNNSDLFEHALTNFLEYKNMNEDEEDIFLKGLLQKCFENIDNNEIGKCAEVIFDNLNDEKSINLFKSDVPFFIPDEGIEFNVANAEFKIKSKDVKRILKIKHILGIPVDIKEMFPPFNTEYLSYKGASILEIAITTPSSMFKVTPKRKELEFLAKIFKELKHHIGKSIKLAEETGSSYYYYSDTDSESNSSEHSGGEEGGAAGGGGSGRGGTKTKKEGKTFLQKLQTPDSSTTGGGAGTDGGGAAGASDSAEEMSPEIERLLLGDNFEAIRDFISTTPNINLVRSSDKATPLHLATYNGQDAIVELLLQKGAKLDLKNIEGKTPLDLAIGNGNFKVQKLIRDKEAELKAIEDLALPVDGYGAAVRPRGADESSKEQEESEHSTSVIGYEAYFPDHL